MVLKGIHTHLRCLAEAHPPLGGIADSHTTIFRKLENIWEIVIPIDAFNPSIASGPLSGSLANIVVRVTDDPIRVYYRGCINQPKISATSPTAF